MSQVKFVFLKDFWLQCRHWIRGRKEWLRKKTQEAGVSAPVTNISNPSNCQRHWAEAPLERAGARQ